MTFRIGIISDTHGLLRPEAEGGLSGVDHIIHAGDIGRPDIVDALRRIAPVTAIRGNVDSGDWARGYLDTKLVRLAGKSIYVLHDLKTLQVDPAPASTSSSPGIPTCRRSIRSAAFST
jgi:putative phosphoesterase